MLCLLTIQLFLLAGCQERRDPGDAAATCELDACVDAGDDGLGCCIDAHGYGLEDTDDLEHLAANCQGDECDETGYISESAAICIAQTCGLLPGIGSCGASFQLGSSGPSWLVENHTQSCADGGNLCGGGQTMGIDAVTGECGAIGSWSN